MVQSHVGCGWILYLRLLKDTTSARKPHHSLSAAPSSSRRIQRLLHTKTHKSYIKSTQHFIFIPTSMKRKKQTGKKRLDRITEGTSCSVRLQTVSSLLLLPHLLHPVKKKKKTVQVDHNILMLTKTFGLKRNKLWKQLWFRLCCT